MDLLRQLNAFENPAISGIGRRASRVPLRSFRSIDDAVAYYTRPLPHPAGGLPPPANCGITRLSGLSDWDFRLFRRPSDVPDDFWELDFACDGFVKARALVCVVIGDRNASSCAARRRAAAHTRNHTHQTTTAARAVELGVPRPRHAHLHQLHLPHPRRPAVRAARRQPDRLLAHIVRPRRRRARRRAVRRFSFSLSLQLRCHSLLCVAISRFPTRTNNNKKRHSLVLEGVDCAFAAWLNGAFLGLSKDSRLPAEFEVSPLLRAGRNLLALMVRCVLCVLCVLCAVLRWARCAVWWFGTH